MTAKRRRPLWPWVLIGLLGLVVIVLLGSFVWRLFNPPVTPFVEGDGNGAGQRQVIQVNIVNASRVDGAAQRAMAFLRERGFDVVEISSDPATAQRSHVIDRLGDRLSAEKVASVLGIADTLVVSDIDSMMFVRASVVLGTDLESLPLFND
ncbi:MAG: LytR C-terminal domain-containing protein ['Candidatus Kapabacteria' thiocyanatum]|uniref:LytR/CpsA/Psr regulator C-terminal domain-containing protein n=1 Tax=Candidatus Kapaibacterium thiocyanatum TaxID=1895771 RepID=A0A1M3KXS4_9BACT|nr:LytR C-terminal domain-containing protein ['Candidatus Kapabacteria' thiocyanatum]OJX57190.1 MAG: hypothetical protein BGO89_11880 ['Candidatus Kapabacteria' thiocyanatum]